MGTKQLGWPVAGFLAARCLALTLSVSTAAIALSVGTAQAADPKKARDKMVELNKQALLSFDAKDFETARDLLTKALKEAKAAALEDDKMTARTYLHLGAVYWVGFQDQAVALQNFTLAKKIRPDIQLTPSIETPDLKSVFDMATVEAEPEPVPARPVTPPRPTPRPTPVSPTPRFMGDQGGEPDLPASFSSPLLCAVPDMVPPSKEMTIRCALKPGLNAKMVQIHYRTPGVEAYQSLGMRRTAKGWYIVTLPSSVMKVGTLQVYFDARDAADNELATNGQIDSPSIIQVKKKGVAKAAEEDDCPPDDPLCSYRKKKKGEEYDAGLHRRRAGAIWIGMGVGAAWGYVPAGKLEWEKNVKVSTMTTMAGRFHILPELGYMWSDDFAFAIQGRIEFIKQEQSMYQDPNDPNKKWMLTPNTAVTGSPTTMAAAGFVRAIWYTDLSSGGNFRLSYSADVGGGFIRFPVKPTKIPEKNVSLDSDGKPTFADSSKIIYLTDTRPVGMFLVGGTIGLMLNVSRYFALGLDCRALTGLPNAGVVVEGQLTAQLAFGGAKGPAPTGDEEDEGEGGSGSAPGPAGGGGGGGGDAPPPADEPPTMDLGNEEEE
jgi:hypothetical protein